MRVDGKVTFSVHVTFVTLIEMASGAPSGGQKLQSYKVTSFGGEYSMSNLQAPFVLGLDVGTSSTRALLFDATGATVPDVVSQLSYKLNIAEDGEVSVDADMLVAVVAQTVSAALQAAGPLAEHIAAVALDTFWHGLLGIDAHGQAITPVITWQDTRAVAAVHALRARFDENAVHVRTGARFHASYWPAKLRWLAETDHATFARVAQWISFGEYLHRQFLGRSVCSLSMASATGLLLFRERHWDTELMQALGVREEQLPQVGDVGDSIHGLTATYAAEWPQLRNVPWFPAIGDGATACIGSGCATPENWSLTMGTSSAARVVVAPERVVPTPGLWLYLIDAKRAVVGGALSEGGNLLTWISKTFKLPALKDAEPLVAGLVADSHGLTILPFISGERSPGWHAEARMTVAGLCLETTPSEVLLASMEALAYQISVVHAQLATVLKMEHAAHKVVASGGALLGSNKLQQIIADTLDTSIYPSLNHEASARGSALLALEALGVIPDVARVAPALLDAVTPDKKRGAIYRQAAERQRKLYQLLLPG